MKVYEFLRKYRMCSNARVRIATGLRGTTANVRDEELRFLPEYGVFGLTVKSFDVIDNVLTIHAR